jgi:hypothetical protein
MPRLIAAVIFISLSYPICAFLITLTNDIGGGIFGLLTSSISGAGDITISSLFDPNGTNVGAGFLVGAAGGAAILAVGSIGILFSYALVAFLGLLVAFISLAFRQFLLIALLLFAPVAIVAWIFPGNDKLWKLWWGTFSKLLLLYPLIMILIASGRSFAVVVQEVSPQGGDGAFTGIVATFIKIVAYVGPYFFIPAAFKFAGGVFATVSGMANDRSRGILDRQKKYRQGQMSHNWERRAGRQIQQKRADMVGRLQSQASKRGTVGSLLMRGAAGSIGGYNIHAANSARQAQVGKEINDQIATGRDEDIRGLTVNWKTIKSMGFEKAMQQGLAQYKSDGKTRQYKSLGGKWVDEANVIAGHSRWDNDTFAQQAALSYEMRKASTDDEIQGISRNYGALAKQSWGLSSQQAAGAWIGAGFENQNLHLEFKHTDWQTGQLNGKEIAKEVYERRGSYPMSQMSAHTIKQLRESYVQAENAGDLDTQNKIKAIAETFVQRGMAGGMQLGGGGEEPPILTPAQVTQQQQPGAATGERGAGQVYGSGAGHVNEELRRLAQLTGVRDGSSEPPFPQK